MWDSVYIYLLISVLFLGISNLFFKKSVQHIGSINTTLWYYIFGFLFSCILYFSVKKTIITNYTELKWPLFVAIFLFISVFLFNLALQEIKTSIASAARSLAFIITIMVNLYFFKDILSSKNLLKIILGISSVLLMK